MAVVHDADGVSEDRMLSFAQWTNLSETTFLQEPTDPAADYRLRIFTPDQELPFAGHPTLGSARAWLAAGGTPRTTGQVIQECEIGLVRILIDDDGTLAFAAPPLVRPGEVDSDTLAKAMAALQLKPGQIQAAQWVDNGPGWLGLLLHDAQAVLDVVPDPQAFADHDLRIGLIGPYTSTSSTPRVQTEQIDSSPDVEVRALICMGGTVREDPVTGSLNAGFATWLTRAGMAPEEYVASQGTLLGRRGRVTVRNDGEDIWVGGQAQVIVHGTVTF